MNALLGRIMWAFGSALISGVAYAATAAAIPDVPVNGTTASVLGSIVAGLVWGGMKLREKWSKDGVGRTADDYLQEALKQANLERDRFKLERDKLTDDARAAWSSKNADALELGTLRAENAFLKEQLRINTEAMAQLRRGVMGVGQLVDTVKDRMESTEKRLTNSGSAPLGGN